MAETELRGQSGEPAELEEQKSALENTGKESLEQEETLTGIQIRAGAGGRVAPVRRVRQGPGRAGAVLFIDDPDDDAGLCVQVWCRKTWNGVSMSAESFFRWQVKLRRPT